MVVVVVVVEVVVVKERKRDVAIGWEGIRKAFRRVILWLNLRR